MYCCLITSMTPRVVRRRAGMTGSDMNDSVMNGSMPRDTPNSKARSFAASSWSLTSTRLSSAHEARDLQDELAEHSPRSPQR